jgi:hypothetical protein
VRFTGRAAAIAAGLHQQQRRSEDVGPIADQHDTYFVVVVVLLALVEAEGLVDESALLELVEPDVPEAPIELVLPGVEPPVLPPIALELLPGVPLLPGVDVLLLELVVSEEGAGVTVVDELVEVDGAGVSVRFVQAPSETAATSARAAHEVRFAFIGETP